MTVQLEVGKKYVNGYGGVVEIVAYLADHVYPYVSVNDNNYSADGRAYDGWHLHNLVGEYTEPAVIQRAGEPDVELHRLGCFTLEMLRTLTKREKAQLKFLYETFYSTLLPIHLEDPVHNEIGRLWRIARARLHAGVTGESLEGKPPWYLAGKESKDA